MKSDFLPVGIKTENRKCLVVGGGNVALRKIETLIDYKGRTTVIAPETVDKIDFYHEKGIIDLQQRAYRSPEVLDYDIVISASDDRTVNQAVFEDCRQHNIPVNVVDNPDLCTFIFPAVVKRDCLSVSVLTDGKAPFLARQLRLILEDVFPKRWAKIAQLASRFRPMVHKKWKGRPDQKVASFERFLGADWQTLIKDCTDEELSRELEKMLEG